MELPQIIQDIEKRVVNNDLDDALSLIQTYCEEQKYEVLRTEALAQFSNLNSIEKLKRTNQIDEDKYLTEWSKMSASVLSLKDQLITVIKNPEVYAEMEAAAKVVVQPSEPAPSPSTPQAPVIQLTSTSNNDWFKKVIIGLFALFGIATLVAIFIGTQFQIGASVAMLALTWVLKIFDENTKFKQQRLILMQQQNASAVRA